MRIILFVSFCYAFINLSAQSSNSIDNSFLANLKKTNEDSAKVTALNMLAETNYNLNIKASLKYAQEALNIAQRIKYDAGAKRSYNILRKVYRRLGNYELAIRFTLSSLPIAERLKDSTEMFNCYLALGNIYSSLEKYSEATFYLRKAYSLGTSINSNQLPSVLNFLGRNHNKKGNYDSALILINNALVMERKNPQGGYTLSYIYNNLAEVYVSLKKYDQAEYFYFQSMNLPDDKKTSYGLTFTLNGLARLYHAWNRNDKAIDAALKSVAIATKNLFRGRAKESYGILYMIYEKNKDFENAMHYYRQFNLYQDSISSEEKSKAIEDMKINYETKRIETENELLRKSAQLKDAELKQRFVQGWAFLLGCGALLFLVFMLYRHNKQRTKTNHLLNQYNRDLAEQVYKRTLDLVDSNAELVRQNNQLEQFGYIIAHNLRAPVARILGLTSIVNSPDFNMPADQKVIDRLELTSRELDTVIRDLNSILDIKKGINETLEHVDLTQRLEKVKENLREKIRESNTIIHSDFSAKNSISAIPAYLESILYNLISNAIKYRSDDRSPLVDISSYVEGNMVYMIVEDNGIGIDLENQKDKLFNLYQRFHHHVEGKGMGLFLVKTQIEAMNGKIDVQSEVNVGTRFKICLPLNPLT